MAEALIAVPAGYATIGQGAGPMIVTERAGLFAKNGLDVKSRIMGGAVGVVRGLMQGEIHFGNLAAPALLRADLLGEANLVYLTGGINQQFLMGRPGIEERKQLAGKTIGLAGDKGLNDVLVYFVIEQLKKQGIDGVTPIPIEGSGHKGVESLVRGACDAAIVTPPECIGAKRRGCSYLIDFADYGLNFALGGIAARKSYIAAHRDIARRFVTAYVEGMHCYRTDRAFTAQVQAEYSGLQDPTLAEETYDMTQPGMPRVPYPVLKSLKVALDVMSRDLPQAAGADPKQFVDDSFLRELEESGFIDSLYGKK